jgi:prepilin-type processing-associated H-X9-DG protein
VEVINTRQHVMAVNQTGACGAYPSYSQSGDCLWAGLWAGHLGTTNYAFVDGHVKSLRPQQTIGNDVNMWHRSNKMPTDSMPWGGGNALTNTRNNLAAVQQRYQ